LGIIAGWTNENSGAAVLFFILCYWFLKIKQKNKNISLFEVLGSCGFIIGFCFMIAAPGNYVRIDAVNFGRQVSDPTMILFIKRAFEITGMFINNYGLILFSVSAIILFDVIHHQKGNIKPSAWHFTLASLASMYSMILSPSFPDRASLIVFVFLFITLGITITHIELPFLLKRNLPIMYVILFIVMSFSFLSATKNIMGIYLRWQERIAYIQSEKKNGNFDITVKAPIPATNRHTVLYNLADLAQDSDGWPNTSVAEYFGLHSIKGLNNTEAWEPLSIKDLLNHVLKK
jgi:hypothetical protein